ncbi:hypothetical protein [Anaerotruncus rubiinfantis]|jgi:hypothetical protein|uniref:hypothetical protein n=1 Tax=Anaerotruncus rubiinfantis TaxID=1720200 RepID=UPI001897EF1A|nr:hypothetical protein [Anaerotruncus rubiinfantis]
MMMEMATKSSGIYNVPLLFIRPRGIYNITKLGTSSCASSTVSDILFSTDEIFLSPFKRGGYCYYILGREPIPVRYLDGYYLVDRADIGMFIGERSLEKLKSSIYDCLDSLWRVYCEDTDDNLTNDAKLLKQRIMAIIARRK